MFTDEDAKRILEEVQANRQALDSCALHEFEKGNAKLFPKYKCKNCGGTIDGSELWAYEQGLAHGRTHPLLPKTDMKIVTICLVYPSGNPDYPYIATACVAVDSNEATMAAAEALAKPIIESGSHVMSQVFVVAPDEEIAKLGRGESITIESINGSTKTNT